MANIKKIVKNKIESIKSTIQRHSLYYNRYGFKCRIYFELNKDQDPDFQCNTVLVENFMEYVKSVKRQIYSAEDDVRLKTIDRIHSETLEQLKLYSEVQADYDKLSVKQKEKIGYDEGMWKTPNMKLMTEMYKLHKVQKLHKTEYTADGEHNLWIIKPSGNARGMGIHLGNNLKTIMEGNDKSGDRLVMKYIENPLQLTVENLGLNQIKFDIRQWVLVKSQQPLEIYLFSSFYCRLCSAKFNIKDIQNQNAHQTNFSINKTNFKNDLEKSALDSDFLKKYIWDLKGVNWDKVIKPKIVQMVIITLLAVSDKMDHRENSFEIYGYDILIDEKLNPWLLEINLSPACLERSDFLTEMLDGMAIDLLKVLKIDGCSKDNESGGDRKSKRKNYWQMIYKGSIDNKLGQFGNGHDKYMEITGAKLNIHGEKFLENRIVKNYSRVQMQKLVRGFLARRKYRRMVQKLRNFSEVMGFTITYDKTQFFDDIVKWREYELDKKVMKIQKAIRGFQHFKRTYLSIANLFEQP